MEVAEVADAHAVVLFADDYAAEDVRCAVQACAERIAVVVTSHRAEYEALRGELPNVVIILPRPTWGWVLLDAVRAAVSRDPRRS